MSRPTKQGLTDVYKAKLSLQYILDFLRENDPTGEGGTSTKEYRLVEFQQRLGNKIPPEDEEGISQTKEAIKKRNYRAKLKEKQDYENLLKEMRIKAKKS